MDKNYSVTVAEASRELTKRETIMYKDTTACKRLDDETKNGKVIITPVIWLVLSVHNEKARDKKDYEQYVIVDKNGERYLTGSQSFYNGFLDIAEEMEGEEFQIEAYRLPSKNYTGKDFLTCGLI